MNSPFENQPISQDSPFKANGRFGRLSYAAWTFLFTLVLVTAILLIMFTFGFTNPEGAPDFFYAWLNLYSNSLYSRYLY